MGKNSILDDFDDWVSKELKKILETSIDKESALKYLRRADLLINTSKFISNYDENVRILSAAGNNGFNQYGLKEDSEIMTLIYEIMTWMNTVEIKDQSEFNKMWGVCKFLENHDENIKVLGKYEEEKKKYGFKEYTINKAKASNTKKYDDGNR